MKNERKLLKWLLSGFFILIFCVGCSNSGSSSNDAGSNPNDGSWLDVHGAGAQRSDPKAGDPADYPEGHGPQGDAIRIYNYVRLVRGDSSISNSYSIVDTGQTRYFDNMSETTAHIAGSSFYGQDANYAGLQSSYTDNDDGTITDNNTGLIWVKEHGSKMTYADAVSGASTCAVGGYTDWRLPTIKELYSLMSFAGTDPSSGAADKTKLIPFIDTNFFTFEYGPGTSDTIINERIIDAQYASATECVSDRDVMKRAIGLNLADGRIKAYPSETVTLPQGSWTMTYFVKYVRGGNGSYGGNSFSDNGDGTIADAATGLVWDKDDSGKGLNWQEALVWVQARNAENYKGYADWRLPNAKELQSIVDYTRSPSTTNSPALDPFFNTSTITDEAGDTDYPFFWTGTTHQAMDTSYVITGGSGVYISFGEALGHFSVQELINQNSTGGRVDSVSGNIINASNHQGTITVLITDTTKFTKNGAVASIANVTSGVFIEVTGTKQNDGTWLATEISISDQPPAPPATGGTGGNL